MLIENVKIKHRNGIGWILLSLVLIIPAWLGVILTLKRNPVRLRKSASLILFNNRAFGNSLFWGFIFAFIGISFCIADLPSGDDTMIFYLYSIPTALTGVLLMLYCAVYANYKKAVDTVLEKLVNDPQFDYTQPLTGRRVIQPKQLYEILCDLQENGIITFSELSEGCVAVQIIAPELQPFLDGWKPNQSTQTQTTVTWTCPGCGASNTTANGRCEYCGNTEQKTK